MRIEYGPVLCKHDPGECAGCQRRTSCRAPEQETLPHDCQCPVPFHTGAYALESHGYGTMNHECPIHGRDIE